MKITMPNIAASAPDDCICEFPGGCVCTSDEKALRYFVAGEMECMPPMTPEQREECLKEIDSIEGYRRADYEHSDDSDLACAVLQAWTDYCRDKGML